MTTTDLKPGDIVQHPEHGYGVVLKNFPGVPTIYFAGEHGYDTTRRFTGWERAESMPPADEKPTSATVTLYCSDCGGAIADIAMIEVNREGDRYLDFCSEEAHTCPPAQPDEPTEPGIHVSVCDMRLVSLMQNPTGGRLFADVKSGHIYDWDDLTERGTVTIGWDE